MWSDFLASYFVGVDRMGGQRYFKRACTNSKRCMVLNLLSALPWMKSLLH